MHTTYTIEPETNNLSKLLAIPRQVTEIELELDFYISGFTPGSLFEEPSYPQIEEVNIICAFLTFYNEDTNDVTYYRLAKDKLHLVWDSLTEAEVQKLDTCLFVAKESNPDAEDYFDYYFN